MTIDAISPWSKVRSGGPIFSAAQVRIALLRSQFPLIFLRALHARDKIGTVSPGSLHIQQISEDEERGKNSDPGVCGTD